MNEGRAIHEVTDMGAVRAAASASDQPIPESGTMVQRGQGSPSMLAWVLRPVGFVMMFAGFLLVLPPLCAVVGAIPFLGRVAGTGRWLLSFVLALPLGLGTIAVPWVVFRPFIGVPLAILALASASFVIRLLIKARQAKS